MMRFLAPKGLRAEVTEGIDLEHGIMLTGQKVTIGSGQGDTLRLGAADVVPGHLTFERRADGRGWEYFTSDRGVTLVDRGNPRTGPVRAGMWLRLGRETRIDLLRAPLPATPAGETADAEPASLPLPVALGIMGAMILGALALGGAFGGRSGPEISLRTMPWVSGSADLSVALDACLAETRMPERAVAARDPASAFWRVMAFRASDPVGAAEAETELTAKIREILASAHFLLMENKPLEASETLRRLEYVLPVGVTNCPILTASRFDLALLELRGSR